MWQAKRTWRKSGLSPTSTGSGNARPDSSSAETCDLRYPGQADLFLTFFCLVFNACANSMGSLFTKMHEHGQALLHCSVFSLRLEMKPCVESRKGQSVRDQASGPVSTNTELVGNKNVRAPIPAETRFSLSLVSSRCHNDKGARKQKRAWHLTVLRRGEEKRQSWLPH